MSRSEFTAALFITNLEELFIIPEKGDTAARCYLE